jgi:hypothetical protein
MAQKPPSLAEQTVIYADELQAEAQTASATYRQSDKVVAAASDIQTDVDAATAGLEAVMATLETVEQKVRALDEMQGGITGLAGLLLGEVGNTTQGVSRLLVSARSPAALQGLDEAEQAKAEFVVASGDAGRAKERAGEAASTAAEAHAQTGDALRAVRTLQDMTRQLGSFVVAQSKAFETGATKASEAAGNLKEYARHV